MNKIRIKRTSLYFFISIFFVFGLLTQTVLGNPELNSKEFQISYSIMATPSIAIDGNIALDSYMSSTIGSSSDGLTPLTAHRIENLVIDADLNGSGLYIRNTNRYVVIDNCTISRSGFDTGDAGIRLVNTSYITISNCDINNNIGQGIYISTSNITTITQNDIYQNAEEGITLVDTNYTLIAENNVQINGYTGVRISGISIYNTLIRNLVRFQPSTGIYLNTDASNTTVADNQIIEQYGGSGLYMKSSYNHISGNLIENNSGNGIYLGQDSTNNWITGNKINNNTASGIGFDWYTDNNHIIGNWIKNNGNHAIALSYLSDDTEIIANHMEKNGLYISGPIYSAPSNTIESNYIDGKKLYYYQNQPGIILDGNTLQNVGQLILYECDGATIQNFNISNTSVGIGVFGSGDTKIINNVVTDNYLTGIRVSFSYRCNITRNKAESNGDGITIYRSYWSTVSKNTLINNEGTGLSFGDQTYYNNITDNQINSNNIGISHSSGSNHNIFTSNTLHGNTIYAAAIYSGSNNTYTQSDIEDSGFFIGTSTTNPNIIDSTNTINGKQLEYYINQNGLTLDGGVLTNTSQVLLVNCTNSIVRNFSFDDIAVPICISRGENFQIYNNQISNSYQAIRLYLTNEINATANTISNSTTGIYVYNTDKSNFSRNIITNCGNNGIHFRYLATSNTLSGNRLVNSQINVESDCFANIDFDQTDYNSINNKRILYYKNQTGLTIDGDVNSNISRIFLDHCNDTVIQNLDLSNVYTGIYLRYCLNTEIKNCAIDGAYYSGIEVYRSDNTTITKNTITNTMKGIYLDYSDNCSLTENEVYNCTSGICLYESEDNTLIRNSVSDNRKYGIFLEEPSLYFAYGARNNTVSYNICNKNGIAGIHITYHSIQNVIHNNTCKNNGMDDIQDYGTINLFTGNTITDPDPDDEFLIIIIIGGLIIIVFASGVLIIFRRR